MRRDAFYGMAAALLLGCGVRNRGESDGGGGGSRADDTLASQSVADARTLLGQTGGKLPPLPSREVVLALAQRLREQAADEGSKTRATELHALAAGVYERLYRVEGTNTDGEAAVFEGLAASRTLATPEGCDGALLAARIAGDMKRDAAVTYAALYRLERRLLPLVPDAAFARAPARAPGGAGGEGTAPVPPSGGAVSPGSPAARCARHVRTLLAELSPFRPAASVLKDVDLRLAEDGAEGRESLPPAQASPASSAPHIVGIEHWPGEDAARVVITLDRAARFRVGDEMPAGSLAPRTYVELDGVGPGEGRSEVPTSGIITQIRAEPTVSGSRVLVEFDGRAFRRVFYLPEPFRVILDVARRPPGAGSNGRRTKRTVARVVLDPGHGGTDPGAIGAAGVREKDVTLDIARRVAPLLATDGVAVVLTRDEDRTVTLEERTARANAASADVFVSIHCNATENRAHHGVETYVLEAATGGVAMRIAARENATSPGASAEIGSILARMRLVDQAPRSAHLATLLQRAAVASLASDYPDTLDGGVHTAGFYVLVGARMPSALFETSYLSNPSEEQRLGSEDYRQRIAEGIANALRAYREGR